VLGVVEGPITRDRELAEEPNFERGHEAIRRHMPRRRKTRKKPAARKATTKPRARSRKKSGPKKTK
jgi:hypothetical protein